MNSELVHGLEVELALIQQRIVDARAELDGVPDDDGEAAAIARFKVGALQQHLSWFADVSGKIVRAELKAVSDVEGFVKWRASMLAARAALAELEPFERKIPAAQLAVDNAYANFLNAERILGEHLSHPVPNPDFASRGAVRKWAERKTELETAVEERGAKLRSAKEALRELQFEAARKQDAVFARPGGLLFQAEQLAPRVPQKEQAVN